MIGRTVLTVLALAVLGYLVWRMWRPVIKPKREVPKGKANLYFFHTDWCGFCQKAAPEWAKLEEHINKTPTFGDTVVTPVSINAESDRKTADLYEVEAYPTVKLETATGLYEYKQAVTYDGLIQFLRQSLGNET
jgi:thiol-disulfide isomerase/thioredoxin